MLADCNGMINYQTIEVNGTFAIHIILHNSLTQGAKSVFPQKFSFVLFCFDLYGQFCLFSVKNK